MMTICTVSLDKLLFQIYPQVCIVCKSQINAVVCKYVASVLLDHKYVYWYMHRLLLIICLLFIKTLFMILTKRFVVHKKLHKYHLTKKKTLFYFMRIKKRLLLYSIVNAGAWWGMLLHQC